MANKRLIQAAERWKNKKLPSERTIKKPRVTPITLPDSPTSSFILEYDSFGNELIAKNNELFGDTDAEIPEGKNGEIENMYILKRLGLITTLAKNHQLRSANLWPITPAQSENLLQAGNLPKPDEYWEDLALILYDTSQNGENPREAQAFYESLKAHKQDLGLSNSDLESKLLIVNTGIEKDQDMPHGVKPIVLPGVTKVYQLEVLEKIGQNYSFENGLDNGLPGVDELGSGNRTLYMPHETEDIGLRVLIRGRYLDLCAGVRDLAVSDSVGRVNFAP